MTQHTPLYAESHPLVSLRGVSKANDAAISRRHGPCPDEIAASACRPPRNDTRGHGLRRWWKSRRTPRVVAVVWASLSIAVVSGVAVRKGRERGGGDGRGQPLRPHRRSGLAAPAADARRLRADRPECRRESRGAVRLDLSCGPSGRTWSTRSASPAGTCTGWCLARGAARPWAPGSAARCGQDNPAS